jgi:hypothetical protein
MEAERTPSAGKRTRALLLGVVPGLAHIAVLDRPGTGTALFVLFVAGADAALAGLYLVGDRLSGPLYAAGCGVAGAAWLAGFLDVARLALFRDYERRAATRAALSAEGVRRYAAGDYAGARKAFRGCLSIDHRDPDVLFWYACVEARLGKPRRAARSFRRCRKYDAAGRWEFPIREQEARFGLGGAASPRPPASGG